MGWQQKAFSDLSLNQLYQILKLRTDVFVVEQNCPYPELDNQDQDALHLFFESTDVVCVCRIYNKLNKSFIGRVAVSRSYRGQGMASEMIKKAILVAKQTWPEQSIHLSAQSHLTELYKSCGFTVCSKPYLEDGIAHVAMVYAD